MNHSHAARTFQPTVEMIDAAHNVFVAMAVHQTVKPVVREYQAAILQKGQWRIKPEYQSRLGDSVITNPESAYLMGMDNFTVYDAECKKARVAAGLYVDDPEKCPLCVAESNLVSARKRLIDAMEPVTHLGFQALLNGGLEKLDLAVDLSLKLLAPYIPETEKPRQVTQEQVRDTRPKSSGPSL